jgi:tetratricopeptide (TPR) repeat protein
MGTAKDTKESNDYLDELTRKIEASQARVKTYSQALDQVKSIKVIHVLQSELNTVIAQRTGKTPTEEELDLLTKIGDEYLVLEDYAKALEHYNKALSDRRAQSEQRTKSEHKETPQRKETPQEEERTNDKKLTHLLMRLGIALSFAEELDLSREMYAKITENSKDEQTQKLVQKLVEPTTKREEILDLIKLDFAQPEEAPEEDSTNENESKKARTNFILLSLLILIALTSIFLAIRLGTL